VKKERSPVEGDDATDSFIGRNEKRFLREVVYDGIVNLEKGAFPLLALPQFLLRLFPLGDIEEGYDGTDGFAITDHGMGPILHRKTGATLSPKNIIVDIDSPVFMKTYINWTLVNGKWRAIFVSVVFERMHVLAQQFDGSVVTEQANCRSIAEEARARRVATKDSFCRGIEDKTDSLLAFLQGFFCMFPFSYVF
jgi:hypothetical protein